MVVWRFGINWHDACMVLAGNWRGRQTLRMNYETGYDEIMAARRNPTVPQPAGNVQPAAQQVSDDGMSFWDFLDVVNPLQHIPVVNTLYRELTGDQIKPSTQMMGGVLFGGPVGLVSAAFSSMIEQESGQSVGATLVAALDGEDQPAAASVADALPHQPSRAGGDGGGVMLAEWQGDNLWTGGAGDAVAQPAALTQIASAAPAAQSIASAAPAAQNITSAAPAGETLTEALPAGTPAGHHIMPASFLEEPITAGGTVVASAPSAVTSPQVAAATSPQVAAAETARAVTPDNVGVQLASSRGVDEAKLIPLKDVRRYNRAIPLRSGLSSSKESAVKAAEVARAARAVKQAEQQQLRQSPQAPVAPQQPSAPLAATQRATATDRDGEPAAPIADPFGRTISGDSLQQRMMEALEKYRASHRSGLHGAGV